MCSIKQVFVLTALLSIFQLVSSYHGFFPTPRPQQFRRQAPSNNFLNNGFDWGNSNAEPKRFSNDNDAIVFPTDADSNQNDRPWDNPRPSNSWPFSRQWNRPQSSWNQQNSFNPTPSPITTSTVAVPGMATPRTPCENACQITPEYNPVCGTDGITYTNERWLKCAINCGKRVFATFRGRCVNPQG